jgi:hypothetical protein
MTDKEMEASDQEQHLPPPTLPPPVTSPPKLKLDLSSSSKQEEKIVNLVKHTSLASKIEENDAIKPFHLFIGTWNVNARPPSKSDGLLAWILGGDRRTRRSASQSRSLSMPDVLPMDSEADEENKYTNMLPDIYVIGLQELVKLDSKAAMSDKQGLHRQAEWEAWLLRVINSSALVNRGVAKKKRSLSQKKPRRISDGKGTSFKLLEKRMLMGLLLLVFVKNEVDVELMGSAQTAAGILGVRFTSSP